jgi:hypothetical protein
MSDAYFLASITSRTVRRLRWDKANPAKYGQSLEANRKYWDKQKAAYADLDKQYRADLEKLKAVDLHKERRFNYKETADRYAAEIERDYGVKLNVCETSDLDLCL